VDGDVSIPRAINRSEKFRLPFATVPSSDAGHAGAVPRFRSVLAPGLCEVSSVLLALFTRGAERRKTQGFAVKREKAGKMGVLQRLMGAG
jgi:hypothetical protein